MKFTLEWLKDHLDTNAAPEAIGEKLTAIGLELEALEDRAKLYAPFKAAYVEKAEPHPDADRLQICTVKTADHGTMKVVCGAPNARAGMTGIFAPEGSTIPGTGTVLKKGLIRGVESCGMLVSEREMGLSDEHEGIIDLPDATAVGTPFAELFGLDEPVFEIALTPNRADCAGVYGIARDLAAAGLGTLKTPDSSPVKGAAGPCPVSISIEDKEGCPLFFGRLIKGVKNGPSPAWLQNCLKSIGLRPISALVDITNLMAFSYARPLHVYDADRLHGGITVREAKAGETLKALNDKSYETQGGEVAICDESGLIGLGGIVGGVSTGCADDTVNVLLEAAYFDPMRIARTGRDLGIDSDARYRFERGVDPEFTRAGMEIATRLILELCGGEASDIAQAGDVPSWQRSIEYDPAYVKTLIGLDVPAKEQAAILGALGFEVTGDGPFQVTPPSWRGDIEGRADLTEEIIRIVGFDRIPSVSVRSETAVPAVAEAPMTARARKARATLSARGFNECITWSFLNRTQALAFGANDNAIKGLTLKNPISSEMDVMRPSLLANLLEAAKRNADQGYADVRLCEIGPAFRSPKPDGQDVIAAGLRAGQDSPRHWADPNAARTPDLYDAKADAIAVLEACGAPGENAQVTRDAPGYYHPGRSGALRLGPNILAVFGELHPAILEEAGLKGRVCGFEIFLQNIPAPRKKAGTEKPLLMLEPLQPVSRDFAFLVDDTVPAEDMIRAAKSADKALIQSASVFDIYTGKGVEPGKKSVALNVVLQPKNGSLTDKDLDSLMDKIAGAIEKKTGGTLRG